jgi:hypothetical protein
MSAEDNYIAETAAAIRALIDPDKLPPEGLDDLFASYALLALSKGVEVTNEDVHDAWSAWASKYDPENDSLVPFEELNAKTQAEDTVFRDAIRQVAEDLADKS